MTRICENIIQPPGKISSERSLKLRPHHLLCILTYIGKGYTPNFTRNLDQIIDNINAGHNVITLVEGPDDICAPRLNDCHDDCHCYDADIQYTDACALQDIKRFFKDSHQDITIGSTFHLTPQTTQVMRKAYTNGTIRTACLNCEWKDLCDEIRDQNYTRAKLKS